MNFAPAFDSVPGLTLLELHWCADCAADTILVRPAGPDSPEGGCADCGAAIWLWVPVEQWAEETLDGDPGHEDGWGDGFDRQGAAVAAGVAA